MTVKNVVQYKVYNFAFLSCVWTYLVIPWLHFIFIKFCPLFLCWGQSMTDSDCLCIKWRLLRIVIVIMIRCIFLITCYLERSVDFIKISILIPSESLFIGCLHSGFWHLHSVLAQVSLSLSWYVVMCNINSSHAFVYMQVTCMGDIIDPRLYITF